MAYQVGDRIITTTDPKRINMDFSNLVGEVIEVMTEDRYRISFDKKKPSGDAKGWVVKEHSIQGLVEPEPSEDEIAMLFGIGPRPPSEDSPLVELLEHIDNALRNGTKMTRANLAFEFLLKHLELSRLDLPSYVHDMQEDR